MQKFSGIDLSAVEPLTRAQQAAIRGGNTARGGWRCTRSGYLYGTRSLCRAGCAPPPGGLAAPGAAADCRYE